MLETDAPYLTPSPYRGTRNESKYILNIAQKISDIYAIDINKIAEITTKNAYKLFQL
jgi:TatD DNase family protein